MLDKTQALLDLMDKYDCSIDDAADLLGKSRNTIKMYRCYGVDARDITQNDFELLRFKLKERQEKQNANKRKKRKR